MIISKTPFRISLVGGGSDLKSFYKDSPGAVVSTTIDKYIYLSAHKYFYPTQYLLKYSKTENVDNINNIEHNIIREVFKCFKVKNIDFNSTADIPSGTGMGSSSSFTVGLIHLCSYKNGLLLPRHEIAKLACEIEIDVLGEPIGKQDQYGCAIGGLKLIEFNSDDSVQTTPIHLNHKQSLILNSNLLLFYTDKRRSASSVLKEQKKNTISSLKVKNNLKDLSEMAHVLFSELSSGNIDSVGEFLDISWKKKKELATNISNPELDNIYNTAIKNGVIGGKILGAGGGGFFLFYVPQSKHSEVRKALNFLTELNFNFENEGSQIIYS